jgi:hypothetical protein
MKLGELRAKWDDLQSKWEDFTRTKAFAIGFSVLFALVFVGGIIWTLVRPEQGWWSDGAEADAHHVHVHAPHEAGAHEQAEPPHEPPPRPMVRP